MFLWHILLAVTDRFVQVALCCSFPSMEQNQDMKLNHFFFFWGSKCETMWTFSSPSKNLSSGHFVTYSGVSFAWISAVTNGDLDDVNLKEHMHVSAILI